MSSELLINEIIQRKNKGESYEEIKNSLIKRRYPLPLIEESIKGAKKELSLITTPTKVVGLSAIIVISILLIFIYFPGIEKTEIKETPSESFTNTSLQSKVLDCGRVLIKENCTENCFMNDCYIEAAKECNPAKILVESDIFFFVNIYSVSEFEIVGKEKGKCVEKQTIKENLATFPKEMKQMMLEGGTKISEIEEAEKRARESSEVMIGKESICKYEIGEFLRKLKEQKEGKISFSSEDTEKYECSGSLYEIEGSEFQTGSFGIENRTLECPEGTTFYGETYEYNNEGEQIPIPICRDNSLTCMPCENCVEGKEKEVISNYEVVCWQCIFDSDCKEGYLCSEENECIPDYP